jgi:hypothetical protein
MVAHMGALGGVAPSMHLAAPGVLPGIVTSTVAVSPIAVSLNVAPLEGSVHIESTVANGSWI